MNGFSWLQNGVTAHRGWSARFPENTLPSFAAAIALGADWLELDVRTTKDGRLVVIHDADTGRIGDRNIIVAESTWGQLQTVDAAFGFRKVGGVAPIGRGPCRIPLLEDVFKLVMAQRQTRVSFQPKDDCVQPILTMAATLGAEPWIGFNDGDFGKMAAVKRCHRSLPVFWDRYGGNLDADIETARANGFDAMVVHCNDATEKAAQAIKCAGLEPGVWTIDDEPGLRRVVSMGFARVYTNTPDILLRLKNAC